MLRFFIDSSVLFAAAYSTRGHAADLLKAALLIKLTLVISPMVLEETRRNLAYVDISTLPAFERLITTIPFENVHPSREEVLAATTVVVTKDAPIVAAAKLAGVDALVTMDKKHLLNHPEIEIFAQTKVWTPKEAYELFISGG